VAIYSLSSGPEAVLSRVSIVVAIDSVTAHPKMFGMYA
jgi:hypothetical protein